MSVWREASEFALDHGVAHEIEAQKEWIAREPGNGRPYYQLGALLRMQGREDEGLALMLEAVSLDPGLAAAHVALAQIYAVRGDAAAAWRHARSAAGAGDAEAEEMLRRYRVPED